MLDGRLALIHPTYIVGLGLIPKPWPLDALVLYKKMTLKSCSSVIHTGQALTLKNWFLTAEYSNAVRRDEE